MIAALLALGRPATKSQIGKRCGLTDTQVGGALSNINGIACADTERWGLKEWIDNEYDGIVGENTLVLLLRKAAVHGEQSIEFALRSESELLTVPGSGPSHLRHS